jgi:hypothetical protein
LTTLLKNLQETIALLQEKLKHDYWTEAGNFKSAFKLCQKVDVVKSLLGLMVQQILQEFQITDDCKKQVCQI